MADWVAEQQRRHEEERKERPRRLEKARERGVPVPGPAPLAAHLYTTDTPGEYLRQYVNRTTAEPRHAVLRPYHNEATATKNARVMQQAVMFFART